MDKVRFGIVGCGNMGCGHGRRMWSGSVENGVLTAVCDINDAKMDFFREMCKDEISYFATAQEMFKSGKCDVVIICTPHYSHPELAILAMDSGLHCIIEKPAGVYTNQVNEMLERAKSADTLLGIMFNERTHPSYQKARELIKDGKIGEIKRVNWILTNWYRTQSYYDSGSWRATWVGEGGGVLYNQAPHQLDLLWWIIGMMPSRLHAFCHFGKWHDIEVEDDVSCYLEYPNGATGVFVTTTADAPGTNRFEITGTKGTIVIDNKNLYFTELEIDESVHRYTSTEGFKRPDAKPTIKYDAPKSYPAHDGILNNFANAVLGKEELFAPATEGLNGVILANAMHLSSWLSKTVELPIDGDLFLSELNKRIASSRAKESADSKVEIQGK